MMPAVAGSTRSVLVVGAGVAGMHASLVLAEAGVHVYLVESSASVGGLWNVLDRTFPTHSCGVCHMSPKNPAHCPVMEVERHPRITLMVNSRVEEVSGEIGDFRVRVAIRPAFVAPELCDGCGECLNACQAEVKAPAYLGLGVRKAIYRPSGRSAPGGLAVDEEACTKCGECVRACPNGAIDLLAEGSHADISVGAIILCPGMSPCDPAVRPEYLYGSSKDVLTGLEFETLVATTAQTGGALLRPSDRARPQSIAFIQCVGSRDRWRANPYCSSVCCMYAIKEAILAKTVLPDASVTVFYTDVRALGKGYDEYYARAKSLGVEFENCRVSGVEDRCGSLEVTAESVGTVRCHRFDLVVLSNGLVPGSSLGALSEAVRVERDDFGFVRALHGGRSQVMTSRRGVCVCGGAAGPQDIPKAILSSGACALQALLAVGPQEDRHGRPAAQGVNADTGAQAHQQCAPSCVGAAGPADSTIDGTSVSTTPPGAAGSGPRMGVFACRCEAPMGSVDPIGLVQTVSEMNLDDVVVVKELPPLCKREGLEALAREVACHSVDRVVAAACTPRRIQDVIESCLAKAGLARGMVEVANIREQCGWAHERGKAAMRKAGDLVAMAAAGVRLAKPLVQRARQIPAGAVVIGGGPAGMQAAASLADLGHEVHVVEREGVLGGRARTLARTLDGTDVRGILEELEERIRSGGRVTVHLSSRVGSVHRTDGGFRLLIVRNPDRHGTSCSRDDETLAEVPARGAEAEGSDAQHGGVEVSCGAVVLATGALEAPGPPSLPAPDGERVLTQTQLEERLWPSCDVTGAVRSIVMIQCAGSRNEARPYCSQVCCSQALKNAIKLKEERPEIEVYVLHRDIRIPGAAEAFYERARELGVVFVRHPDGEPPSVVGADDLSGRQGLAVEVNDTVLGETIAIPADLVVLSTGVEGAADRGIAEALGVSIDACGFFAEANVKVQPVEFGTPGVFVCGLARGPGLLTDALISAEAAAARAGCYLAGREVHTVPNVSRVHARRCSGCGVCVDACAYGARSLDEESRLVAVDEFLCRGCGACQAACPSGAASHAGFEAQRVVAVLDAALG